jgi:hypothetical protein
VISWVVGGLSEDSIFGGSRLAFDDFYRCRSAATGGDWRQCWRLEKKRNMSNRERERAFILRLNNILGSYSATQ